MSDQKQKRSRQRSWIPYPSIHRKEQWDLNCWPWVCVHWNTANSCRRIFCLYARGGQIGSWLFRWPWRAPNAGEVPQGIRKQ